MFTAGTGLVGWRHSSGPDSVHRDKRNGLELHSKQTVSFALGLTKEEVEFLYGRRHIPVFYLYCQSTISRRWCGHHPGNTPGWESTDVWPVKQVRLSKPGRRNMGEPALASRAFLMKKSKGEGRVSTDKRGAP